MGSVRSRPFLHFRDLIELGLTIKTSMRTLYHKCDDFNNRFNEFCYLLIKITLKSNRMCDYYILIGLGERHKLIKYVPLNEWQNLKRRLFKDANFGQKYHIFRLLCRFSRHWKAIKEFQWAYMEARILRYCMRTNSFRYIVRLFPYDLARFSKILNDDSLIT